MFSFLNNLSNFFCILFLFSYLPYFLSFIHVCVGPLLIINTTNVFLLFYTASFNQSMIESCIIHDQNVSEGGGLGGRAFIRSFLNTYCYWCSCFMLAVAVVVLLLLLLLLVLLLLLLLVVVVVVMELVVVGAPEASVFSLV